VNPIFSWNNSLERCAFLCTIYNASACFSIHFLWGFDFVSMIGFFPEHVILEKCRSVNLLVELVLLCLS